MEQQPAKNKVNVDEVNKLIEQATSKPGVNEILAIQRQWFEVEQVLNLVNEITESTPIIRSSCCSSPNS